MRLVLSLSSDGALGAPHTPGARGITPLHLAAASGDGATAALLASSSPAALLAWFCAHTTDTGATPADAALAAGGAAAQTHAALARRLSNARVLAAQLASTSDEAPEPAANALPPPFDDAALARFLLRSFAPSDTATPAAPGERQLYNTQRMASRRLQALCFPPFAIANALRQGLWLPPPSAAAMAALAPPALPTWRQAWAVNQALNGGVRMTVLLINLVMVALAGLPRLRGAYERHGVAALRAYAFVQFLLLPTLMELRTRSALGFDISWPYEGTVLKAILSAHLAALPLPLRDVLTLLGAQWALLPVSRFTGVSLWPHSVAPPAVGTLLHAAMAVAAVAAERRSWAAWRLARRKRLADGFLLARKQA